MRFPRRPPGALPWLGGAATCGLVVIMAGGLAQSGSVLPLPQAPAPRAAVRHAPAAHTTAADFHQIILPDLVVVDPHGVDAARLARLGHIRGLRNMLAVDGATITIGGRKANVIGVNASAYRSWTSLRTASNQRLWAALASGGFLASAGAAKSLGLHQGSHYRLAGAGATTLTFGGTASLGITGIDLVVSAAQSAKLGLIHNVAALVSAPGTAIGRLRAQVRAVTGPGPAVVTLRQPGLLPVDAAPTGRPATYIQLFQESAAQFCPGLSWTVLAAIGQIESADGRNNGPSTAGALGPMQFLPSTWARWGIAAFGEPSPPNIMDPYDAVPSAARYLCAAGAGTPAGVPGAVFAYNHAHWYVTEVLGLAQAYARAYG